MAEHTPPAKLWRTLCNSLKYLLLHKYMANSALILYLRFKVSLISQFEKLGQNDLNKKYSKFFSRKCILKF